MAMTGTDSGVYRVTEIIGTSNVSWEDAAKPAVETAGKSLRDVRVAEVTKLDMKVEGGKVVEPPRVSWRLFGLSQSVTVAA